MRQIGIMAGALALAAALGGAAMAQDYPYGYAYTGNGDSGLSGFAGLRGSLSFGSDVKSTATVAGAPVPLRGAFNMGGGGSLFIGTRLPYGFRAEAEALYRYRPLSSISSGPASVALSGGTHMAGPMANLYFDLPVPSFPFRPYVGAGAGMLYTDTKAKNAGVNVLSGSRWNFAWQLMAGVQVPLSQSSRLTAQYRYLSVQDAKVNCPGCRANVNTHGVDLGVEMDL